MKEYYPNEVVLREDTRGKSIAVWAGTPLPAWDPGKRIEEMSKAGVEIDALFADETIEAEQKRTADEFLRMSPWTEEKR